MNKEKQDIHDAIADAIVRSGWRCKDYLDTGEDSRELKEYTDRLVDAALYALKEVN